MGWVVTWLLVMAIHLIEITTCTMGSDDAWLASLILFSPALAIVLAAIFIMRQHHRRFLWMAWPLVFLVPWAAFFVWPFLTGASSAGHHLCSVLKAEPAFDSYPASWWQPLWAPVQLALLGGVIVAVFVCWKTPANRPVVR